jgi:hypothetical protein
VIQPKAFGRKLPRNDWEGDGLAKWKTCMDHSAGRMVCWATNGRIDKDGAVYRDSIHPHELGGVNLEYAAREIHAVAGLDLVIKRNWPLASIKTHLRNGRGLIITGRYSEIPREYRHQAAADFAHAMWVSHMSAATGNIRLWDALNPAVKEYGRWIPQRYIWDFMSSLNNDCGYVPLQPLGG